MQPLVKRRKGKENVWKNSTAGRDTSKACCWNHRLETNLKEQFSGWKTSRSTGPQFKHIRQIRATESIVNVGITVTRQQSRSEHWAGDFAIFLATHPSRLSSREQTKPHLALGANFSKWTVGRCEAARWRLKRLKSWQRITRKAGWNKLSDVGGESAFSHLRISLQTHVGKLESCRRAGSHNGNPILTCLSTPFFTIARARSSIGEMVCGEHHD